MVLMMIMGESFLHLLRVLVVLLLCMKQASGFNSAVGDANIRFIEKEREALLTFKQGLVDDYGHLSSWGSEDGKKECCKWRGIKCRNQTGHVIMLHLHVADYNSASSFKPLRGKISPSLFELEHLNSLDLSYNDFGGSRIPMFIGNLPKLRYLNLSNANFGGTIPYHLGNLTNLQYLNLGRTGVSVENLAWLSRLSSLRYLDMSVVDLSTAIDWVQAINMLPSLIELHIYACQLPAVVPPSLSFVNSSTSLEILDLTENYLSSSIYHWLFNFSSSLVDVDLSGNNLKGSIPDAFQSMKSLTRLFLSGCQLQGSIPKSLGNISTLRTLELSSNQLEGSIPKSLGNICTLQTLILSWNNFTEELPKFIQNLSGCTEDSLETLDLRSNELSGSLPGMTRFSSLRELYLGNNRLTCFFNIKLGQPPALVVLDLAENEIRGSLPDLTDFSSLILLSLSGNQLNGTLTETVGQLSKLERLDVSFNSLEGFISEAHLLNLPRLKDLDLSFNSLSLNLSSHWVPPFQLERISLAACKSGPHFPKWLHTQKNLVGIDISRNEISDSIPKWFWDLSTRSSYLNLSYNQISGRLPNLSSKFSDFPIIDLSSNKLNGPLPLFPSNLTSLDLSKNMFSGSISSLRALTGGFPSIDLSSNNLNGPLPLFPSNLASLDLSKNMFSGSVSSLCAITGGALSYIDLSNNLLSEGLPDCWMNFKELVVLNLANNNLSGKIPHSIGSLYQIKSLHLRRNRFFGELPSTLKNCTKLEVLDLGENKLSGKIPAWIGKSLSQVVVLSLRCNEFYGSILGNLCPLKNIQILDLSQNNITGTIPSCLNNFTAMSQKESLSKTISHSYISSRRGSSSGGWTFYGQDYVDTAMVVLKGLQLEYRNNLGLVRSIDLSTNKLIGEIPQEISSLIGLISLNLSRNNVTGQITPKIGQLKSLESLDLSRNQLFGEIPASLSTLSFLGVLDLSNNNFSGKIPKGTQLQSFNPSAYMGNFNLCGPPLLNKCPGDETGQDPPITGGSKDPNIEENKDGFITPGFYVSMGLGFTLGFWGVCGSLLLKNSWRYAYFHFVNNIGDKLYVITAVNMARLQRRLRG